MKPLHANIARLNRCPCCQSKYSTNGNRKTNVGKSAARNQQKKELRQQMNEF